MNDDVNIIREAREAFNLWCTGATEDNAQTFIVGHAASLLDAAEHLVAERDELRASTGGASQPAGDDVDTIREALSELGKAHYRHRLSEFRTNGRAALDRIVVERDAAERLADSSFGKAEQYLQAAQVSDAMREAAEAERDDWKKIAATTKDERDTAAAERDELRARFQQQADAGDDRWSAVVSSAALATPGPWQERASDGEPDEAYIVGYIHTRAHIVAEHIDPPDAAFVVALANWFFARQAFGGASGASSTAVRLDGRVKVWVAVAFVAGFCVGRARGLVAQALERGPW